MNWALLAPFVVQHGIEAGMKLLEWATSGKEATAEDFDELRATVNKSKEEYLAESRRRLGIEPQPPPPQG
jgi:hypothetical protein